MDLLHASKLFIKRNASTILTCLGGAGVITTAVTAVTATPKAMRLLDEVKEEKGDELTKWDVVRTVGPVYIPSILIGTSTIACIFGANVLNKHRQVAIMSAYALLDNSYKEYKAKVVELYGEEADKKVREGIAKDKYTETEDVGKQLFYDDYSGRFFESTSEQVIKAEYALNRTLSIDYGVYLNEFYEMLGLDTVDYGDYMGWSTYYLSEMQWNSWIEFEHTKTIMEDGMECTIITMSSEPIFDFENY